MWASIAWGGLAIVSGALITRTGVRWGILVYVCMCVPNVLAAWLLNPGPRKPALALPAAEAAASAHEALLAGKVAAVERAEAEESKKVGAGEGAEELLRLSSNAKVHLPELNVVNAWIALALTLTTPQTAGLIAAIADKGSEPSQVKRGRITSPSPRQSVHFSTDAEADSAAAASARDQPAGPQQRLTAHSLARHAAPHHHPRHSTSGGGSGGAGSEHVSHHARHAADSSSGLRTRLLASSVNHSRTPSNVSMASAEGAAAAPPSFLIRAHHPVTTGPATAASCPSVHEDHEGSEAGSGCSTPRSTAALLERDREGASSAGRQAAETAAGPVPAAAVTLALAQLHQAAAMTEPQPVAAVEQRSDSAWDLPAAAAAAGSDAAEAAASAPPATAPAASNPVSALAALLCPAPCPCDGCTTEEAAAAVAASASDSLVLLQMTGDVGRTLVAHEPYRFDGVQSKAGVEAEIISAAVGEVDAAVTVGEPAAADKAQVGLPPPIELRASDELVAAAKSALLVAQAQQAAAQQREAEGGIGYLLSQPRVCVFLLRALIIGFGIGTQTSFAFLLVREMGGTELLMGVMLLVSWSRLDGRRIALFSADLDY